MTVTNKSPNDPVRSDPVVSDRIAVDLKTLIGLAKQAALINLRPKKIRASQSGLYLSSIKGRGMEFDEARLYQPGDDIRSIDWRVTARSGKTHTKIYREERERPVFISVDYRATMRFATRGVFKSVQAAKIAALLAWAAERRGDRIGGQVFSDDGCQELKPQASKRAVLHLLNALVKPNYAHQQAMSLEQVLMRLRQHANPGSLIYLISDFRGLNQQTEPHLSKLARHCDLVLIHLYDPLECQLPERGHYRFTNQQRELTIDSGNQQQRNHYQQQFQQRQQLLQSISRKWAIPTLACATTDDPMELLR